MSLRITGCLRSRKKRLRAAGHGHDLGLGRAQAQVGDQRRVGPQEGQHVPPVAIEVRQVAVTVALGEVAGVAATALVADQPVSRVVEASAAVAWVGSVR